MVKNRHSAGFAHIFLLAALLVVVVLIAVVAFRVVRDTQQHNAAVQKERALYAKLDGEAQSYIQTINQKYPGKVTTNDSCSYTSAEWSQGWLGCDVGATITYAATNSRVDYAQIIDYANAQQQDLPWGPGKDNMSAADQENSTIKANKVYRQNKAISCSVSYYQSSSLHIDASCGGNALAEYYPVVNK